MTANLRHLTVLDVIALNEQIMLESKQNSALLDESLLQGAVMHPMMTAHFEDADLVRQAASLIAGIALGHAFVDGNKRTALAAGAIFLELNGYVIQSEPVEFGKHIEALVKHEIALEAFIGWLRERLSPFLGT